jgi:hypothetical protein
MPILLANEVVQWLPAMLIVTAAGLIVGLAAIVLRAFVSMHGAGRNLGKPAIITGVLSPLFFFMQLGPELAQAGRLVLMSPILLGLIAPALYPKKATEIRGFEVLPQKGRDSEAE